jgi:hypothetical protein
VGIFGNGGTTGGSTYCGGGAPAVRAAKSACKVV